jgi:uracil-DNA glycosylase
VHDLRNIRRSGTAVVLLDRGSDLPFACTGVCGKMLACPMKHASTDWLQRKSVALKYSDKSDLGLSEKLDILHAEMGACRQCQEAGYPIVPGAISSGAVTAKVMLVGQAPGITEPQARRPFHGSAGRRLFAWFAQIGWEESWFRRTQYITAITKCYPGKNKSGRGDRVPTRAEQKLCAPFLERQLALVQPTLIIPVGSLAIRHFLGKAKLVDVVGTIRRDLQQRWLVPLPHPSGASLWLNDLENQERVKQALEHLQRLGSSI